MLRPVVTINVPAMGDSISEGTVVEWLKKVNDMVAEDEDVAVIETDKVSVNIKAPHAGKISGLLHAVDDTVEVGAPLYAIDTDAVGETQSSTPVDVADSAASSSTPAPTTATKTTTTNEEEASAEPVSVHVPNLGDSVTEGTLVQWNKAVGEHVDQDEAYAVIETDKVVVDLKSPISGVITQQCVEADSNIEVGALVVVITPDAGSFSNAGSIPNPAPVAAAAPVAATPVAQSVQSQQDASLNHHRVPSIHFRHGKRQVIDAQLGFGAAVPAATATSGGLSVPSQHAGVYNVPPSHHIDAIDPLSLPPMYGRLPPMDEDEMMLIEMGGAL